MPGATRAVAAAPDGARGFATAGRGLAVLDLNARTVIGGVPLSGVPAALAVSPDGARVYAARKNGIEVIDRLAISKLGVRSWRGRRSTSRSRRRARSSSRRAGRS